MKALTTEPVNEECIEQQDGSEKQSTTDLNNALLLAQELRASISERTISKPKNEISVHLR
jgi:hypothetical protein